MSENRSEALRYAHVHQDRFISELTELVRIPSISTDPAHKGDMVEATEFLAEDMRRIGLENVQIYETPGHPVIYGDWLHAGQAPTILVYGHYDVQPAEPLELWESDPFGPEQRNGKLYGRGVSDMKGQVMASLKAVEAILQTGKLPVNIKFLLEGEEEIGSPHLGPFMRTHTDLLRADFSLNPDAGMLAKGIPAIVYGLRGLAYFELRVYGPSHDLHSGIYGGVVHNPAQALCELIAGMHDSQGTVTLPGFYDRVRPLAEAERRELAGLPTGSAFYKEQTGAPQLYGEPEYSPTERVGGRPTLEVHGLLSGFTGAGSKTVIPAWAMAKLSSRLVPDQDPEEIHQSLRAYLKANAPATIRWELDSYGGSPAAITDRDTPWTQAITRALETVWGRSPVYKREGGSIPVVADMKEVLGMDSVLTGFGLPDDNYHAPNEKFDIDNYSQGVDTLIHFFYNLVDKE